MCLVAQSVTKSVRLFVTPWTTACQDPLFMGILQAKILEWVAIPFSTLFSWPMDRTCVSCISRQILYCLSHQGNPERKWKWKSLQSCPTLWDPMDNSPPGSSVHGILHWSGLPFPSPGNPPNPEIKPGCPTLWADSLPPGSHWISHMYTCVSSFLDFLPIQASSERWVEFPALCSWFSLLSGPRRVLHVSQSQSPCSPHLLSPWFPFACSVHLHLFFYALLFKVNSTIEEWLAYGRHSLNICWINTKGKDERLDLGNTEETWWIIGYERPEHLLFLTQVTR